MLNGFCICICCGFCISVGFLGKFSYFEMVETVAISVCNILWYMVQKYLVDSDHHHRMISSLCYKMYVVCFYSVEKMGNFHYDPV